MNGIIIVNKPAGMTSHDVVGKIRKIFKTKKVGHFGTLDPDATGVLVVGIGDATKLGQFLEYDSKEYLCTMMIGKATDTYDDSGTVIATCPVKNIDTDNLDYVLARFIGVSKQLPPMYSAIKVNGKKLYEYARNNEEVKIEPRTIEIKKLKRITPVIYNDNKAEFSFITSVSKGTYIRSLCVDIALKLGYPGLMKNLSRTRSGSFDINDAYTLEQIENGEYRLYPMLDVFKEDYKTNNEVCVQKALHGMKISPKTIEELFGKQVERFIVHEGENLIAVYGLNEEKTGYEAKRVWN